MVLLTQLPPEIILNILGNLDPDDLGRVPRCCRLLRNFIKGNGLLYKSVYYHTLDAPPSDAALNWEQEIQDLVRLQRVCRSSTTDKHAELRFVHDTVTRILKNASTGASRAVRSETYPSSSRNVALLTGLFQDESNREAFLSRSFLFERARGIANRFGNRPREEHQLSARLHSLYGMPQLRRGMGRTRSTSMYPFACSKVYDLREYSRATRWGPFMNDGSERVDWEKVEAILLVLRANIKGKGLDSFPIFSNLWNTPFAGSWPGSYVAWPSTERSELERQDPYDVSGTWMRVVCFLDYNDFFSYNFPLGDELPNNVPRQALDVGEATRVIMMKIHVTEIEWPEGEEGKGHPTVHFRGFSRSLDGSWDENANSDLRGLVRMTPEGEVRWTTYSIFDGEEKWKSEGIQLGGIRSARGVVGNWFDRDYDPHGPCGPTAFWKASDRSPENDDAKVMVADFLPIISGGRGGDMNAEVVAGLTIRFARYTVSDHVTAFQLHFGGNESPGNPYQNLSSFLSTFLRQPFAFEGFGSDDDDEEEDDEYDPGREGQLVGDSEEESEHEEDEDGDGEEEEEGHESYQGSHDPGTHD